MTIAASSAKAKVDKKLLLCCLLTGCDALAILMLALRSFHPYRRFADIETSNQRRASALYPTVEKNPSSPEPDTTDQLQNADAPSSEGATGGVSKSKSPACKSREGRVEQIEAGKRHKRVELLPAESPMNNKRTFHGDPGEDTIYEPPPRSSNTPSADPLTHRESVDCDLQMDASPIFPPELHLLSLDDCNFPDMLEKAELHGDKSESQWTDVVDLFGIGSSSSSSNSTAGFFDIEAYFESICSCKSDSSEQTAPTCAYTRQDEEDVDFTVTPEGSYGGASGQAVFLPSQQPTAVNHNSTQGVEASCTLAGNQRFNFEGVAQSFSVSPHAQHCRIPTPPPQEDDWLFTYIKDRALSDIWQ